MEDTGGAEALEENMLAPRVWKCYRPADSWWGEGCQAMLFWHSYRTCKGEPKNAVKCSMIFNCAHHNDCDGCKLHHFQLPQVEKAHSLGPGGVGVHAFLQWDM